VSDRAEGLHSGSPRELLARIEAERRGDAFLLYRDAEGHQRLLDLEAAPPRLFIGRHTDSDVAVPWDTEASRLHAELERIAGEWTVVDDGRSRNGTFVNEERVTGRRLLGDGDMIRVGHTLLVFRQPRASQTWTTTAPAGGRTLTVTPAQRRVLVALCRPFARSTSFASPAPNRKIAEELFLSEDTVKTHLRALFEVFDIGGVPQNEKRAALAHAAIERGIVTAHDLAAGPEP
jgi:hypothetical protein